MLDCKQASQLISQSLDRNLTLRERFALQLHLFVCKYCKQFSQHMQTLRVALKRMTSAIENNDTIKLPAAAKKHIADMVEANHSQS
jgi:predicted anti-sigma-YlaC factor YlaD